MARTTTAVALAAGAATVALVLLSGASGFTVFLGLVCVVAMLGSAFSVGLGRTARATSVTVNGEQVLAQGIGRGGRGFLGAHAVVVTDSSILSVSGRPWGVGRLAVVIPRSQIESVESIMDFLQVGDGRTTITLKECLPSQVAALVLAVRSPERDDGSRPVDRGRAVRGRRSGLSSRCLGGSAGAL